MKIHMSDLYHSARHLASSEHGCVNLCMVTLFHNEGIFRGFGNRWTDFEPWVSSELAPCSKKHGELCFLEFSWESND